MKLPQSMLVGGALLTTTRQPTIRVSNFVAQKFGLWSSMIQWVFTYLRELTRVHSNVRTERLFYLVTHFATRISKCGDRNHKGSAWNQATKRKQQGIRTCGEIFDQCK